MTTAFFNISSKLYVLAMFVISVACFSGEGCRVAARGDRGSVAGANLVGQVMEQVSRLRAIAPTTVVETGRCVGSYWLGGLFVHAERLLIRHDEIKTVEAVRLLIDWLHVDSFR